MADNVVEILVTSRNKTREGFRAAEADAEASASRISQAFSKMGDQIGAKLKTIGKNLGAGGGLFAGGAGVLSMAGPLGAAGAAMGAFGAIAIPILTKVAKAHAALVQAQQQYNYAVTSKQRQAALLAEKKATDDLTGSEKTLMGPVSQLQALWGKLENQMAPLVVLISRVALLIATDMMPAFQALATTGGNALLTIISYLGQFMHTPFFAAFIQQLGQLTDAIAPLIGQSLVQLLRLFMQLFMQAGPAGVQLLTILLPLIIQLATDLVPVIAAVAKLVVVVLQWLQHTHLLLPVLALVAIAILAMEAPITAVIAAVAILIAIGVELARHWGQIWGFIKGVIEGVWNWIKGHWPLLLGILTGPFGLAIAYIATHFGQIVHTVASVFDAVRHEAARLIDDIVSFFASLPGRIMGAIGSIGSDIWNSVTSGLGAIGSFLGLAAGGIATAAAGGPRGGFTLVGERGPELVRLPRGSHVFPSGQSAGMLGGGGGGRPVVLEFHGGGSGLDALFWTWLQNGVRVKGGDPLMFQRKVAYS